jgi:hypothetical protein
MLHLLLSIIKLFLAILCLIDRLIFSNRINVPRSNTWFMIQFGAMVMVFLPMDLTTFVMSMWATML